MKKLILWLLCIVVCLQITACNKKDSFNTTKSSETTTESDTSLSEDQQKAELDEIYTEIDEANELCNALTKLVYTYWGYNGYEAFFDHDIFLEKDKKFNTKKDYKSGSFYGDANTCYQYRDKIEKTMEDAHTRLKELTVSDNVQKYYDSVKKLYLNVDTYYSFASSFPEGYSKITYSQTFSNHQSEYDSLISELKFDK